MAQTQASQAHPSHPGVDFVWHPLQLPQSLGHDPQSSSGAKHMPSPQTEQGPQSTGHSWQSSLYQGSQSPLPQLLGHSPQSWGHDPQSSKLKGSQMLLPQLGGQGPQSWAQL